MSVITGGMGGLGLIAARHAAAQTKAPIIATSRSGRYTSPGEMPHILMDGILAHTLHYSVKCDCGNALEFHDLMDALAHGIATGKDEQLSHVEHVVAEVRRKMRVLPSSAMYALEGMLLEVQKKIASAIGTHQSYSEKLGNEDVKRLQRHAGEIDELIQQLRQRAEGHGPGSDGAAPELIAKAEELRRRVASHVA